MKEDKTNPLRFLLDSEICQPAIPSAEMTERIIGCAYTVANALGHGFLERVYENAFAHELRKSGFSVVQQQKVEVVYDGKAVGFYEADMIVDNCLIIEIKALRGLDDVHLAQCLNYLKGTGLRLCLLINFGRPRIEVRRVVL